MSDLQPSHPANVSELANIACETGTEGLSEHLARYRDHEVVVIIALVGKARQDAADYVCGICGFATNELRDWPRCRMQVEQTARGLRRKQTREVLFREIEGILGNRWDEEYAPKKGVPVVNGSLPSASASELGHLSRSCFGSSSSNSSASVASRSLARPRSCAAATTSGGREPAVAATCLPTRSSNQHELAT